MRWSGNADWTTALLDVFTIERTCCVSNSGFDLLRLEPVGKGDVLIQAIYNQVRPLITRSKLSDHIIQKVVPGFQDGPRGCSHTQDTMLPSSGNQLVSQPIRPAFYAAQSPVDQEDVVIVTLTSF
ncbi:hypothetical protein PHET_09375 [Paragonimus heterotremus]|uniref:Uncharacterized protein n=1 Tax=Paragonimus heterotremus TaxID=100268 RepID=A0A8J4SIY3_9TREM|nr:hypothetical protein PHET_09375 [Paragonimus heterotremus]